MNADPHRRDFAAGLGGIDVAFSLGPRLALAQQRGDALPGSLAQNRMLDAWIRIDADGSATVFTGKVELGQGILTALAQIAAEELDLPLGRVRMISGDTETARTKASPPAASRSRTAARRCGLPAQKCARILLDLAAKRFGVAADTLTRRPTASSLRPTAARSAMASWRRTSTCIARRRRRSRPSRCGAQDRRQVALGASTFPGKVTGGDRLCAGLAAARNAARPHRAAARATARSSTASTTRRCKAMPGVVAVVRDGSFLGVIAEREEQAIKASAGARSQSADGRPARRCPIRLKSMTPAGAADRGQGHQREAGAAARGRQGRRGDLSQALHGACLDRPVLRGRPIPGRQDDGVDPYPGRISAARQSLPLA